MFLVGFDVLLLSAEFQTKTCGTTDKTGSSDHLRLSGTASANCRLSKVIHSECDKRSISWELVVKKIRFWPKSVNFCRAEFQENFPKSVSERLSLTHELYLDPVSPTSPISLWKWNVVHVLFTFYNILEILENLFLSCELWIFKLLAVETKPVSLGLNYLYVNYV